MTLDRSAGEIALSPNGEYVAYVVNPNGAERCLTETQPKTPIVLRGSQNADGGSEISAYPALGVTNLTNGNTQILDCSLPVYHGVSSQPVHNPCPDGGSLTGLSWNPQGTELAATEFLDNPSRDTPIQDIVLVQADDLDLTTAKHLVPPAGCIYQSPAWTTLVIVVAEGCGQQAVLFQRNLTLVK